MSICVRSQALLALKKLLQTSMLDKESTLSGTLRQRDADEQARDLIARLCHLVFRWNLCAALPGHCNVVGETSPLRWQHQIPSGSAGSNSHGAVGHGNTRQLSHITCTHERKANLRCLYPPLQTEQLSQVRSEQDGHKHRHALALASAAHIESSLKEKIETLKASLSVATAENTSVKAQNAVRCLLTLSCQGRDKVEAYSRLLSMPFITGTHGANYIVVASHTG